MSRISDEKALNLKDALAKVLPSTYTLSLASVSGNPVLTISQSSTAVAGEENATIKIVQKSYSTFPTISLASSEDGRPHLIQVALETSGTAGISVWSTANFSQLLGRVLEQNIDCEVYMRANGTVPSTSDITAANLKTTVRTDVRVVNSGA